MLAGGFKNDLLALGDETPHDDRYAAHRRVHADHDRAARRARSRSRSRASTTRSRTCKLTPPLPPSSTPGSSISGSSDAGLAAARAIDATAVNYPKPPGEEVDQRGDTVDSGVRVGIIAREDADEAWRVALERFPEDRKGQITHQLAMKVSDSQWHKQLSELGGEPAATGRTRTGSGRSRTTRPSARTSSAATTRVGRGARALHRPRLQDVHPRHPARRTRSSSTRRSSSSAARSSRRSDALLQDYVTRQAEARPDASRSCMGEERLTYGELEEAGEPPRAPAARGGLRARRPRLPARAEVPGGDRRDARRRSRPAARTCRSTSRARPRASR